MMNLSLLFSTTRFIVSIIGLILLMNVADFFFYGFHPIVLGCSFLLIALLMMYRLSIIAQTKALQEIHTVLLASASGNFEMRITNISKELSVATHIAWSCNNLLDQ